MPRLNSCIEQNGRTPVMEASLNGHVAVVRMLLNSSGGVNVNCFDNVSNVNPCCLALSDVIVTSRVSDAHYGKGQPKGYTPCGHHPMLLVAFAP